MSSNRIGDSLCKSNLQELDDDFLWQKHEGFLADGHPRLVDSQQVLEQQLVLGAWALRLYHVIGGGTSGAPTRQSLWGLGWLVMSVSRLPFGKSW